MQHSAPSIQPRRFRAVAILLFGSVDALHKRLPLGSRAIANHIKRGDLPEPVRRALIEQIGTEAWRFVSGDSDMIRDARPGVEGATHAAV